ncbi:MAG: hypothetical protein A2139_06650 [Desulfobacca sp. RBG_16_60_12]|nr:MAG: hypothetical protein A2139_06650 [Desulfobacca sp. RBG_16_60_12]
MTVMATLFGVAGIGYAILTWGWPVLVALVVLLLAFEILHRATRSAGERALTTRFVKNDTGRWVPEQRQVEEDASADIE